MSLYVFSHVSFAVTEQKGGRTELLPANIHVVFVSVAVASHCTADVMEKQ